MNFWSFVAENRGEIAQLTLEHLWIVGISTLLAVAVGIPLGILISGTAGAEILLDSPVRVERFLGKPYRSSALLELARAVLSDAG